MNIHTRSTEDKYAQECLTKCILAQYMCKYVQFVMCVIRLATNTTRRYSTIDYTVDFTFAVIGADSVGHVGQRFTNCLSHASSHPHSTIALVSSTQLLREVLILAHNAPEPTWWPGSAHTCWKKLTGLPIPLSGFMGRAQQRQVSRERGRKKRQRREVEENTGKETMDDRRGEASQ